eukprot:5644987-Pyramimonas_sp.AAC.1
MRAAKQLPLAKPLACCSQDHAPAWEEVREKMADTSDLDRMWRIFTGQADVNMIDACGLHHEHDRYAGRGQRPWLASTSATA